MLFFLALLPTVVPLETLSAFGHLEIAGAIAVILPADARGLRAARRAGQTMAAQPESDQAREPRQRHYDGGRGRRRRDEIAHVQLASIRDRALVVVALTGLRVAQEYERGVVFRLGRYQGLRGPGLYWIIPLNIERAVTVDIRTRTVSAEQQETITRDSVTIKVNAVLWYRIVDAARSVIAVADAQAAVYQLALTGLRNIIGQHDLDEVLQERDKINALLREGIANSTAEWGLEVQRFEMKDVELPEAMQQVMAMQAEAIREKRARIIKAEAELEASVKLSSAAAQITMNPAALELRRMQMIAEVGAENNSTVVLMIPSDFVSLAHKLNEYLAQQKA